MPYFHYLCYAPFSLLCYSRLCAEFLGQVYSEIAIGLDCLHILISYYITAMLVFSQLPKAGLHLACFL